MARFKNVNGKRVQLTDKEEAARDAEELEASQPPKQADLDAEIDALADEIDQGKTFTRALAVEVFKMKKATEPTLTPRQFKTRIRNTIAGF